MSQILTHGPGQPADPALADAHIRVWIDHDLCTGDGICEDTCPEVFVIRDDGIAYVHEGDRVMNDPDRRVDAARVSHRHEEAVLWAAQHCPGECIFVEPAA